MIDAPRINFDLHLFIQAQLGAHATQQLHRGGDVLQVRHIADSGRPIAQQTGYQNGQYGILGAGNPDFTVEGNASCYLDVRHFIYSLLERLFAMPGHEFPCP